MGNGGNWEGFWVSVRSHDIEHGGVNMVVRAARGAVIEADMVHSTIIQIGYCHSGEAAKKLPHKARVEARLDQ